MGEARELEQHAAEMMWCGMRRYKVQRQSYIHILRGREDQRIRLVRKREVLAKRGVSMRRWKDIHPERFRRIRRCAETPMLRWYVNGSGPEDIVEEWERYHNETDRVNHDFYFLILAAVNLTPILFVPLLCF